ncbi:MAG: esterase family protein [Gemmataceae bacterium]|nr:esterase family protein [Gemmataceae bacterium]
MTLALVALFALRFEVGLAKGLADGPVSGRVLVVLGSGVGEPHKGIGDLSMRAAPILGADALGLEAGKTVVLDAKSLLFPLAHLSKLERGKYSVQALLDRSRDIRLPDAPGNLLSAPMRVELDPAKEHLVKLVLTKEIPEPKLPKAGNVRWIKLKSEKLSAFWGRPIFLRAGVALPHGWKEDTERRYPLRVHIGGFGKRFTAAGALAPSKESSLRFLHLHLDGAGPLGDPYQMDSANHGPWGAALTEELIPHVEKEYRGIGEPWARVLDGASTGGWVSLALQVFYPDFFNGAWSHCPDPVDFRDMQLFDLYRDEKVFVNVFGFERPGKRTLSGETEYTMRHEVQLERVLGRGGKWTLSGRDWASWNATFGPRGKDGLPVPLWDEEGRIDRKAAEQWRKYDLRHRLEKDWKSLGPKLRGKLRVWVGDADEYFLNNAVQRLDDFLSAAKPAAEARFAYGRRKGHSWRGITQEKMLEEMAAAVEAGRKAAR